jgi:hypothetical protein
MFDPLHEDPGDDDERFGRLSGDVTYYEQDFGRDGFSSLLIGAFNVEANEVLYGDNYPPAGHGYPRRT